MDGTLSHCKDVLDKVIVYRGVYHATLPLWLAGIVLIAHLSDIGSIPIARSRNRDDSIILAPLTESNPPIKS